MALKSHFAYSQSNAEQVAIATCSADISIRHTNASRMIASDIDIKDAWQRLGQSDVTTTLDIYSHVLQRSNQEAANTLDSLIFKQSVNQ